MCPYYTVESLVFSRSVSRNCSTLSQVTQVFFLPGIPVLYIEADNLTGSFLSDFSPSVRITGDSLYGLFAPESKLCRQLMK